MHGLPAKVKTRFPGANKSAIAICHELALEPKSRDEVVRTCPVSGK